MEKARKGKDLIINLAPIVARLQEFVSLELCDEVFEGVRTKERQRKLSLHSLFHFWTAVVLRAPPSLSFALEQARVGADPMVPKLTVALGSFFERCQSLHHGFFMGLYHRIVDRLEEETEGSYAKEMAYLRKHFSGVGIIDGSRCDKIAHRLKILHDVRAVVLPGCMTAVYDLFRGFANRLFFWNDAAISEHKRAAEVIETLPERMLLLGDRLYCTIELFLELKAAKCFGLFRRNKTVKHRKVRRLSRKEVPGGYLEDLLVEIGERERLVEVRLIRLKLNGKTHEAMTNVLDPEVLSAEAIVDLYPLRWQVERLFFALKVVLNLKEFYAANPNAVAMQIYAATAVHAVFRIAQGDVAEKLAVPPEEISTDKLFPRLAIAAYAVSMREVLHEEYQRQVPGQKLLKPSWNRLPFTKTHLSQIRLQHRSNHRKKRKYCKSRGNWKSLRAVPGTRRLLS
jgi:Transposase DDE domain